MDWRVQFEAGMVLRFEAADGSYRRAAPATAKAIDLLASVSVARVSHSIIHRILGARR